MPNGYQGQYPQEPYSGAMFDENGNHVYPQQANPQQQPGQYQQNPYPQAPYPQDSYPQDPYQQQPGQYQQNPYQQQQQGFPQAGTGEPYMQSQQGYNQPYQQNPYAAQPQYPQQQPAPYGQAPMQGYPPQFQQPYGGGYPQQFQQQDPYGYAQQPQQPQPQQPEPDGEIDWSQQGTGYTPLQPQQDAFDASMFEQPQMQQEDDQPFDPSSFEAEDGIASSEAFAAEAKSWGLGKKGKKFSLKPKEQMELREENGRLVLDAFEQEDPNNSIENRERRAHERKINDMIAKNKAAHRFRRALSRISNIASALLAILVMLAGVMRFVPKVAGYEAYPITDTAMAPTINSGSLCYIDTSQKTYDKFNEGDILAYKDSGGNITIAKVASKQEEGRILMVNTEENKSEVAVQDQSIVGKHGISIPFLGRLYDIMWSTRILYLGGALLVISIATMLLGS